MKFITEIQSVSDVITNSSSEVFLMDKTSAEYYYHLEDTNGCVSIQEITWDWLINDGLWEWEMVCEYLGIDKNILGKYYESQTWKGSGYWDGPSEGDWLTFLEIYGDIVEKIIGLYFVDIEDHFENAYTVTDNARDDSYWSDYRH